MRQTELDRQTSPPAAAAEDVEVSPPPAAAAPAAAASPTAAAEVLVLSPPLPSLLAAPAPAPAPPGPAAALVLVLDEPPPPPPDDPEPPECGEVVTICRLPAVQQGVQLRHCWMLQKLCGTRRPAEYQKLVGTAGRTPFGCRNLSRKVPSRGLCFRPDDAAPPKPAAEDVVDELPPPPLEVSGPPLIRPPASLRLLPAHACNKIL
jgi:hypothetical protein